jgi:NAD-dependent protein deacetylase sirtuin 2
MEEAEHASGISAPVPVGPLGFPENWLCLGQNGHCGEVLCSRYVRGHSLGHFQDKRAEGGHEVAISLTDLSVWCYECDSYVASSDVSELLRQLSRAKEAAMAEQPDVATTAPRSIADATFSDEDDDEDSSDESFHAESSEEDSAGSAGAAPDSDENSEASSNVLTGIARAMGLASLDDVDITALRERTPLGQNLDLSGVAAALRERRVEKIVIMGGAGMSVSAGIPDFRTPGTGLYDNLQKYDLPEPTCIFDISYYREKPEPFCLFAKEIYPGNFRPTLTHYFSRLLHEKGMLLRHFTQNIDTLERVAGMPDEILVESHGSFHGAHCIDCSRPAERDVVKSDYFADRIPRCFECGGLVKPDIVFFGESLPERFFHRSSEDMSECDMLLVMGTSLQVHPFAGLADEVVSSCPRVLLNRDPVHEVSREMLQHGFDRGFRFNVPEYNVRDVALLGDLDDVVWRLLNEIGPDWMEEFCEMVYSTEPDGSITRSKLDVLRKEIQDSPTSASSSSESDA